MEIKQHPEGCSFKVRVIPNASSGNALVGVEEGALVVRLRAPALEGKANEALLEYLAERLGLRKRLLRLERGQRSRHKVVMVLGGDRAALERLASPESEE